MKSPSGEPEGKESFHDDSSNNKCANVIMSANGQSAAHFWTTLHLGLIKYLEAGRLRRSSRGSYSRPARHFRACLQHLEDVSGSTWNHTAEEEHKALGVKSLENLQGSVAPPLVSEGLRFCVM